MILFLDGCEGHAAQNFGESGFADGDEAFFGGFGGVGVVDVVDDGDEAVGIGALISVAADGGGDAVEDDVAEDIDGAGDVPDAVGCGRPRKVCGGVVAGRIVLDGVGNAEFETSLEDVGEAPGFGGGVEDPLLNSCCGLCGGMGIESGVTGETVALFGHVEGGVIGEPKAEGRCGCGEALGESCGEAGENAHIAGKTILGIDAAEIERRDGKRCACCRNAYTLRAGGAGGVDEVDRVDTVAAAAFGEIDDVVEDGEAAEVVVLADLVGLVAEEGDGEAAEWCGCGGSLEALWRGGGVDELRSGTEDHAVGLGVGTVACVAGGVEEVGAVGVVEDGGAAVVATVGIGLGEGEVAVGVDGTDGAEEVDADRIGRVDCAGSVGVGGVDGVDGSDVTHEGKHLPSVERFSAISDLELKLVTN